MQALEEVYAKGKGLGSKVTPTMVAYHWTQSCRSQDARRGLDMADATRIIHVCSCLSCPQPSRQTADVWAW